MASGLCVTTYVSPGGGFQCAAISPSTEEACAVFGDEAGTVHFVALPVTWDGASAKAHREKARIECKENAKKKGDNDAKQTSAACVVQ